MYRLTRTIIVKVYVPTCGIALCMYIRGTLFIYIILRYKHESDLNEND